MSYLLRVALPQEIYHEGGAPGKRDLVVNVRVLEEGSGEELLAR